MTCIATGRTVTAVDVDHIRPHKGDSTLFWDPQNWQSLCKPCHSAKTTKQDGGFGNLRGWKKRPRRWVVYGPPAAGKTTWVATRMKRGDLVWDLDRIAAAVAGDGLSPRPQYLVSLCLALREAFLTWSARELHCGLYVIISDRETAEQIAISIGAELVDINAPAADLATRLQERAKGQATWHWP